MIAFRGYVAVLFETAVCPYIASVSPSSLDVLGSLGAAGRGVFCDLECMIQELPAVCEYPFSRRLLLAMASSGKR